MTRKTTYRGRARFEVRRSTEIVECPDNLQQGVACGLANTFVVVAEQVDEDEGAFLHVRKEMVPGCGEEHPDSISSDLLLDGDSAVDVEHFTLVKVFDVQLNICNGNGSRGRSPRGERSDSIGHGHWRSKKVH